MNDNITPNLLRETVNKRAGFNGYNRYLKSLPVWELMWKAASTIESQQKEIDRLTAEIAESQKRVLKVGELPDNLFSYNELIALWYDKPCDKYGSYLLWRGMAWDIPDEYRDLHLIKIKGIMPEHIDEADTINLLVTPYIVPASGVQDEKGAKNGQTDSEMWK